LSLTAEGTNTLDNLRCQMLHCFVAVTSATALLLRQTSGTLEMVFFALANGCHDPQSGMDAQLGPGPDTKPVLQSLFQRDDKSPSLQGRTAAS